MEKIWEFFENMNEMVYVADIDTHELIYMNKKARDKFQMGTMEELAGKKCYQVLQSSSTPCAFCSNEEVQEGSFVEWQYFNPIMKRSYALKDTLVMYQGRRCRMEIAIDNTVQEQFIRHQNQEALANEGMSLALRADSPDKSLDILLEYLGKSLSGERTYIFEKNESGGDDNTYEWVADGVTPEINNLQNVPPDVCASWYRMFQENKSIIIEDIENIRENEPRQYEILKQQNIRSLVVVPLYNDTKIIGFFGVDNPHGESLEYTQNMLEIVGHFIVSCLKRRDLLKELHEMSYHDQLTKLGNRFAMDKYLEDCSDEDSLGVVYCDITGLKRMNDSKGHTAGDELILRAGNSLQKVFSEYGLFRIGGDELLALCPGIEEEELDRRAKLLKETAMADSVVLAVGAVWQETAKGNFDKLLSQADQLMYEDKSAYYKKTGLERRIR